MSYKTQRPIANSGGMKHRSKRERKELKLIIQFIESRIKLEKRRANKMVQFCNIWDQRIKDVEVDLVHNDVSGMERTRLPFIHPTSSPDRVKQSTFPSKDSALVEILKSIQEEARNSAFYHYKHHLALSEAFVDLKRVYDNPTTKMEVAADIINKYTRHKKISS
ncbi:hypothetical protein SNE40_007738 [Patella caerulea]|uniref:Uncharacterized protein n=1 Tax=Patella caerulea TaxID=87958 RepID=A0AAN8K0F4_PATCE